MKVRKTTACYDLTRYRVLSHWDGGAHRSPNELEKMELTEDWFTRRCEALLVPGQQDLDKLRYLLQPSTRGRRNRWLEHAR